MSTVKGVRVKTLKASYTPDTACYRLPQGRIENIMIFCNFHRVVIVGESNTSNLNYAEYTLWSRHHPALLNELISRYPRLLEELLRYSRALHRLGGSAGELTHEAVQQLLLLISLREADAGGHQQIGALRDAWLGARPHLEHRLQHQNDGVRSVFLHNSGGRRGSCWCGM